MAGPYLGRPSQILMASSSSPHSASTAPWLNRASTRLGFSSAALLNELATLRHSSADRPPDFLADAYFSTAFWKSARASALMFRFCSLGMICSALGLFGPPSSASSAPSPAPALCVDGIAVEPHAASDNLAARMAPVR